MFEDKLNESVLQVSIEYQWPLDGVAARFVKGLDGVFVGALVRFPRFQLRILLVRGVGQFLNFALERRKLTNVDKLRRLVLVGKLELGGATLFQIPLWRTRLRYCSKIQIIISKIKNINYII